MSDLKFYWRVNGNTVTDLNGNVVFVAAAQADSRDGAEMAAQLNLVQAAPEMLVALERASDLLHGLGSGGDGNEAALRLSHEQGGESHPLGDVAQDWKLE